MDGVLSSAVVRIVASYVGANPTSPDQLRDLIQAVRAALGSSRQQPEKDAAEPQKPAVSIKKSVTPDHLTCLEDGKQFKSLKRHLRTDHNLTPEEYRAKWGLPKDYPMIASSYSEARSSMARAIGLGQKKAKGRTRKQTPA